MRKRTFLVVICWLLSLLFVPGMEMESPEAAAACSYSATGGDGQVTSQACLSGTFSDYFCKGAPRNC